VRRVLPPIAAALLIAGLLCAAVVAAPAKQSAPADTPRQPSRAIGQPWNGRLVDGVQLPESGAGFYTFDSALRQSPNRGWRRWGTDLNVFRTITVLGEFHAAHPDAPRILVGDLSRRFGGPFGTEFGGPGHASHENGLDVDIYYPRLDRREKPPINVSQVDRKLSQELVDRFVAAGAVLLFVGPKVGLHGPHGVVETLAHHDNHVHVRWPNLSTARR
jgi:murein endopeptidase